MTSYVYVDQPLPISRRVADDYGVVDDKEIRARCHATRGASHYFWVGDREPGDCLLYKGTYESPPDSRQYQEHLFRYHDAGVDITAVEVVDNVGAGGSALLEVGGPGSDMASVKVRSGCGAPLDDTFFVYGYRTRDDPLPPPYTYRPQPCAVHPQPVQLVAAMPVRQRVVVPEPVTFVPPRHCQEYQPVSRGRCQECPPVSMGRCCERPPVSCGQCPECPPMSSSRCPECPSPTTQCQECPPSYCPECPPDDLPQYRTYPRVYDY